MAQATIQMLTNLVSNESLKPQEYRFEPIFSKKNLDLLFFPLGLSNFWVGAWFPFDEGQSNLDPQGFKLSFDTKFVNI